MIHGHEHESSPPLLEDIRIQPATVVDLSIVITDLKMHLDYERGRREAAEAVAENQREAILALKTALRQLDETENLGEDEAGEREDDE